MWKDESSVDFGKVFPGKFTFCSVYPLLNFNGSTVEV